MIKFDEQSSYGFNNEIQSDEFQKELKAEENKILESI